MRIKILITTLTVLFMTVSQLTADKDDDQSSNHDDDDSGCVDCPKTCTPDNCKLPGCYCSTTGLPPGMTREQVPQMVVLTFQNAVRLEDMPLYKDLFKNRNNPNGCPVAGTFFVSHDYTDYRSVQELTSLRHEVGVNSITFRLPQNWWAEAKQKDWKDEMDGEKQILELLGNVNKSTILGQRAPYLQLGGDNQFRALKSSQFKYEASRVSNKYGQSPSPPLAFLWPYTYDYETIQDCDSPQICPKKSYKGIWQVPLLALKDKDDSLCSVLDACKAATTSEVFQLLLKAFQDRYFSNRAPLVLTLSSAWVNNKSKFDGTAAFLSYLRGLRDVFVVTVEKMIEWIEHPTPVQQISDFKPWWCNSTPPQVCPESEQKFCQYDENRRLVNIGETVSSVIRYKTYTCLKQCPKCYPWINDTKGTKC